jgi:myo-inositol 2-dehydrogenase/D-chiro-inositol 1-dehydrogenase
LIPFRAAVHDVVARGEINAVEMVTIVSRDPGTAVDYIKALRIFRDMTISNFDIARWRCLARKSKP